MFAALSLQKYVVPPLLIQHIGAGFGFNVLIMETQLTAEKPEWGLSAKYVVSHITDITVWPSRLQLAFAHLPAAGLHKLLHQHVLTEVSLTILKKKWITCS